MKSLENSILPVCLFALVGVILLGGMALIQAQPTTAVKEIDGQYAGDFSDDRVLVGASSNVFVGSVIKQVGTKERGIGPETQFEINVVKNIKGDLSGSIVLDQLGGYKDGVLYKTPEITDSYNDKPDDYLLRPGSTYIFTTRYSEKEAWYTLNPYPTAIKLVSSATPTDSEQLLSLIDTDSRVQQLETAYTKETLLPEDVAHGNTPNSYKSLKTGQTSAQ